MAKRWRLRPHCSGTQLRGLIDALCDIVPAVKQAAYYEIYGWQGVRTLAETVAYARAKGMFVITDGKRNDIGTRWKPTPRRTSANGCVRRENRKPSVRTR